jgi:EAL and modified HD-GYP domain-containing signal transduction protein
VIVGATPLNLPPERTVIEVLESVQIDDALVAGCSSLVQEGYAGATVEPGVAAKLRLVGALMAGELDLDEIEEIVRTDPALTLQLIRAASIGRLGEPRRRIGTLRQALVLMGARRIRNWAALLVARSAGRGRTDRRFADTLIRARACELLTEQAAGLGHLGFTAGMLSSLEGLLEIPAGQICEGWALSDELIDAAFRGVGPVGFIVADAIVFQQSDPDAQRYGDTDDATLSEAFARAFAWSMTASAALAEAWSSMDAA